MSSLFSPKLRIGNRLFLGCALMLSLNMVGASVRAAEATLSNTTPFVITTHVGSDATTPYSTTIPVTGLLGNITNAKVVIHGLSHTYVQDLQLLLVAPSGKMVLLMANTCGSGDATNDTITFSDTAPSKLPLGSFSFPGNGSWKPTNYNFAPFPAPAPSSSPSAPYGETMAALNGTNPNGNWQLFVYDRTAPVEGGGISGGWSLDLTTDAAPPTVAYSTPIHNEKILLTDFGAGDISGVATDNLGVTSVKVRLGRKRNNINEFWNGTNWVAGSLTFLDATVTGIGTPNATWSLDNVPPTAQLDAGQYQLRVYSVDADGSRSANVDRVFNLNGDLIAPTVSINTPSSSQVLDINNIFGDALSGTAEDNSSNLLGVKLKLGRKRNGVWEYWNGTNFTTTTATFNATVLPVAVGPNPWQLDQPIPASKLDKGGYTLYATATDLAGNFKTSSSRLFTITGTANPEIEAVADSSAGRS